MPGCRRRAPKATGEPSEAVDRIRACLSVHHSARSSTATRPEVLESVGGVLTRDICRSRRRAVDAKTYCRPSLAPRARNHERGVCAPKPAFAEDIRERLANPPSHSAVRVMLARLEKKGHLRHEQQGARNVYSATTSPITAKRAALRQYLQTFFGGSLRDMMASLVRDESWADEDLDALRGEIDRVRKQRR